MGHEDAAFVHQLRAGPEALRDARRLFRQWLSSQAIDPEDCDDLVVVMSELGANALTAADGSPNAIITVRARRGDSHVDLEVENSAEADAGAVTFLDHADPLRGRGRGLMIVAAYTDAIDVVPADRSHGLIVRCRKRCPSRCPVDDTNA